MAEPRPERSPRERRKRETARDRRIKSEADSERRSEYAAHQEFIHRVEMASAHNPDINQQTFRDLIAAYEAEQKEFARKEAELRRDPPDSYYLQRDLTELRRETMQKIKDRLADNPDAEAALHAVAKENQPESVFTPLVRMFYNTDYGGLQLGSLGGAGILGGLAYYFTDNSGAGSLITWGATIAATLVGSYIGSQVYPSKPTVPIPDFKSPAPGQSRSPEVTPPAPSVALNLGTTLPGVTRAPEKPEGPNGYTPEPSPTTPEQPTLSRC